MKEAHGLRDGAVGDQPEPTLTGGSFIVMWGALDLLRLSLH